MPMTIPNRILCADAYTVSSFNLVSPAMRRRAAYHMIYRRFAPPPGLAGSSELPFERPATIGQQWLLEYDPLPAIERFFELRGRKRR